MIKSSYGIDVLVMLEDDQEFICRTPQVDKVMADARGAEGSVIGIDRGHKHGKGCNKIAFLVTTHKEDYYHTTNIEASKNVSAILPIEISVGF